MIILPSENEFQILAAKGGGYYWHFKSANHDIVCASQVYTTKQAAIHGAYVIKNNAADTPVRDYTGA
ncbi:MAG TPA: YegP family protein [Streptosporangiaceae bacterium]